jgi:lysophospholipase L1-like esterase
LSTQATAIELLKTTGQKTAVAAEIAPQPTEISNPAEIPTPGVINPLWMTRHLAKVKEIHERPVDLLFIGDSITEDWELSGPEPWKNLKPIWDRDYGTLNAINLGFGGDTTANVLWRLEHGEIDDLHPKAVVLLIGANNTGRMHWSAEQTASGIDAIVQLIHKKMPEAKIVVLGILPCALFNQKTNLKVNDSLLNKYRDSEFVIYQDLTDVFMKNGKLDPNLFIEGRTSPPTKLLHPSAEGQERMAKALDPLLLKIMSDQLDPLRTN